MRLRLITVFVLQPTVPVLSAQAPWRLAVRSDLNPYYQMAVREVVDVDGNGFPDILGGTDPLFLIRNFGPDGFGTEVPLFWTPGGNPYSRPVVADVDLDGDLDIVMARGDGAPGHPGNNNMLLINDGRGNFTDQTLAR